MSVAGEIASLFVRIRPDLTGFSAEATAGVKGALSSMQEEVNSVARANVTAAVNQVNANEKLATSYRQIGEAAAAGSKEARVAASLAADATRAATIKVNNAAEHTEKRLGGIKEKLLNIGALVGIGFGAEYLLEFTKELTSGAASVQKSVEVIKQAFGADASEVIVKFGDTVAAKLGVSAQLADATSARFGILFRNLGVGQPLAARMTVGFEKLAGAISSIKGVDPSTVFQNLSLAAGGNVRVLKQLGIVVDGASERIAAFKLGLTSSVTQALTPAQKAIAIYALATARLPELLKEAKKHSDDYANVQFRLNATWSNAKDLIGADLLPVFKRYTLQLSDWLERMIQSGALQRDVNTALRVGAAVFHGIWSAISPVVSVLKQLIGMLGGARKAVQILIAAFAISKIAGIASAITGTLIAKGILLIGPAAVAAEGETVVAFAGIGVASEALAATIKAALISTGIGALIVAAAFAAIEIIKHWDTIKAWIKDFASWISSHAALLLTVPIIGQVAFMAIEVIKHWDAIKKWIVDFAGDLKELFVHPINGIKDLFADLGNAVKGIFKGVGKDVLLGFSGIISTILGWVAKIPTSFKIFGQRVGVTNPAIAVKKDFDDFMQGLKGTPGTPEAVSDNALSGKALNDKAAKVGKAARDVLLDNLLDLRGANTAARSQLMAMKLADALFNDQIAKSISDAKARIANAIATGNEKIAAAQKSLADYITNGTLALQKAMQDDNAKIASIAEAAANNLNKIGKMLSDAAGKLIDKNIQLGTGVASAALNKSLTALQTALLSGKAQGDLARLQHQAQQLTSQVNSHDSSQLKAKVQQHIQDLINAAEQGHLSPTKLKSKITDYLKSQGITYKNAGKLLGKAFADGMQADIDALVKQFKNISDEPAKIRAKARNATGAGHDVKVIDVVGEIRKIHKLEKEARDAYQRGLKAHISKVAQARQEKAAAVSAAERAATRTYQTNAIRISQHHFQESQKQTKILTKIAATSKKTAATNAAIASTHVNTSGFPSSTTKNPGKKAGDARATATTGAK